MEIFSDVTGVIPSAKELVFSKLREVHAAHSSTALRNKTDDMIITIERNNIRIKIISIILDSSDITPR